VRGNKADFHLHPKPGRLHLVLGVFPENEQMLALELSHSRKQRADLSLLLLEVSFIFFQHGIILTKAGFLRREIGKGDVDSHGIRKMGG